MNCYAYTILQVIVYGASLTLYVSDELLQVQSSLEFLLICICDNDNGIISLVFKLRIDQGEHE